MTASDTPSGDALELDCSHTHLFRGARLAGPALTGPLTARRVRIVFRDGVEVDAELLQSVDDQRLAIAMPAYQTAAGGDIPAKVWHVAAATHAPTLVLAVGGRVA
ncbi:MAG: hypothetical protein QM611_02085 [Microbacterium sp.]|uniref:hypothetical protein n=1 Tax=Microbacterium sp. TaxID=51671 RepID=UPI0039E6E14C